MAGSSIEVRGGKPTMAAEMALRFGHLRMAAGIVLVAALGWQYVQATRPITLHMSNGGRPEAADRRWSGFLPTTSRSVESRGGA